MNGPAHYAASEQMLEAANQNGVSLGSQHLTIAAAQVHATLALAAATALAAYYGDMPTEDRDAWDEAAGVPEVDDDQRGGDSGARP